MVLRAVKGCLRAARAPQRKVYVDVGANFGNTVAEFAAAHPDHDLYAIEPNIELIGSIARKAAELQRMVTIIAAAAWSYDGTIDIFKSERDESTTALLGKKTYEDRGWPPIDYSRPVVVPCFDFASWLRRSFPAGGVTVKMDVEGAEYTILNRMLADGSLDLIDTLYCEWHYDRFPAMDVESHRALKAQVAKKTDLIDWV